MMEQSLDGMKVAILVTDNFEQVELTGPRGALTQAGAEPLVLANHSDEVQGMNHDEKGDRFHVDAMMKDVSPDEFDAVMLPGGVMNSDKIRMLPEAQAFVKRMAEDGKPIAVICHGAWLLVSSGLVGGRTMTSWPTLRDDIANAGGNWVDQEVVVDGNLVSSRKPQDLPAFNRRMVEVFARSRARKAA
jgi:protease I